MVLHVSCRAQQVLGRQPRIWPDHEIEFQTKIEKVWNQVWNSPSLESSLEWQHCRLGPWIAEVKQDSDRQVHRSSSIIVESNSGSQGNFLLFGTSFDVF